MTGISEEKRKMAVWRRMWMAEKRKGSGKMKREGRRKDGKEK